MVFKHEKRMVLLRVDSLAHVILSAKLSHAIPSSLANVAVGSGNFFCQAGEYS